MVHLQSCRCAQFALTGHSPASVLKLSPANHSLARALKFSLTAHSPASLLKFSPTHHSPALVLIYDLPACLPLQMLPVGLFMALTLWTGNEVYLYLTVAFIQVWG